MPRRLIAIVGPTASGKSTAALELARRLGGEIVNADSRQIYRRMNIGTAKPTAEEQNLVRHHLFDIVEPGDAYSLALYQRDARAALEDIWERGSYAWLVGGSGQYVWALLENWQVPEVEPDLALRQELVAFAALHGPAALHQRLAEIDQVAAIRIDARNVRRVVRAIEVFARTGRPISEWQTKRSPDFEFLLYGMARPREELDARIDARVGAMFETGFVAEVRSLLDSGVTPESPSMSSIGYAQAAAMIHGDISEADAIEQTARATRRFARKQAQWFRMEDDRIKWVADTDAIGMEANIFTSA